MAARNSKKKNITGVRLSAHIIPHAYTIHFEPDLENFTFTGSEEIQIEILQSTSVISLHAAEIEVFSVELIQNKKTQSGKTLYRGKNEEVDFVFKNSAKKGTAVLKITFTGILNDKMRGFYRSAYELNGKTHHMGVTQFESTDARRAFPCFDEPAHKAVFKVSFKVPSDRTVISNTIESEILEHEGGYKTISFTPTPKMSSYLLAFIIGHFESIEKKTKDGTQVRVFVTPGKKKQAEFALDVAVKVLEFYTDYFKIKYPLPTMDLIAIPDFAAGAMENWGAVTYRETALLVDPEHSSTHNKQWVALVIAHELAHQWFGNLVTMEWWTHLWLNEGFASYMEYVAVNSLFPEWHVWTQFVFMDHARALELDGLLNTHAIEVDVNHPAEISEIFDEVSYSKGASVIRMLAEYLGTVAFRNGLREYLKKHSYANASTSHLWESLEKVSNKPVKQIMENWTRLPGYPLLSVTEKKGEVIVVQSRFFSSIFSGEKSTDKTVWLTPVSFVTDKSRKAAYHLLNKKLTSIKSPSFSWIKANKNETSFARVCYSKDLLLSLKKPIASKNFLLSEEDRFGIIRDVFALSEAGKMSLADGLDLVSSYKREESYVVWAEIVADLLKVGNLFAGEAFIEDYRKFCRGLFLEIAGKAGWTKKTKESHAQTLLRSIVLYALGTNGNVKTIEEAQEYFEKSKHELIDADIRGVVYRLAAENGGKEEFAYLLERYKTEKFQEEKDRILRALCAFKNNALLGKVLDFAFSDEVKAQDCFKAVSFIWGNPIGRNLAWQKVQLEWSVIVKKFGGGHLFTRFIKPAANFTTEEKAQEIEKFFKTHESKGLERTIAQVVEQIRSNAALIERDSGRLQEFLSNQ